VQGDVGGSNRPREDGRVKDPQVEIGLVGEKESGGAGLVFALGGEVHVLPTREKVEIVPGRASVAQENEIKHVTSVALTRKTALVTPSKKPLKL